MGAVEGAAQMKNSQRALVRILREIAQENGLAYSAFSFDWSVRLSKGGEHRLVVGYQFPLNPATAAAACTDKALASALMEADGVPCVRHEFFMNPSMYKYTGGRGNWARLLELLAREGELVCKPNEGTSGNLVFRVGDPPALENAVTEIFASHRAMAVSRYYGIRSEHRVIILDGRALVVYEKILPPGGWKHNLDQGASPALVDLSSPFARELEGLASRAAAACGVRFASVDIIDAGEGPRVLEANSGVMMEAFARVGERHFNIAKDVYRQAVSKLW
jgi:glutathione synthase/RimK-type ligase-like ATP-grasp enzyme